MTGRPSSFTQEVADKICERLANGEPLAVICRDDDMPGYRTVYDWADAKPDFAASIAHAREDGFDMIAADCLGIADDSAGDVEYPDSEQEPQGHGGSLRRQKGGASENVQRAKLRIDTRLKLLAKWDPKRYGEKIQTEHSGAVRVEAIKRVVVDAKSA